MIGGKIERMMADDNFHTVLGELDKFLANRGDVAFAKPAIFGGKGEGAVQAEDRKFLVEVRRHSFFRNITTEPF